MICAEIHHVYTGRNQRTVCSSNSGRDSVKCSTNQSELARTPMKQIPRFRSQEDVCRPYDAVHVPGHVTGPGVLKCRGWRNSYQIVCSLARHLTGAEGTFPDFDTAWLIERALFLKRSLPAENKEKVEFLD